LKFEVLAVSIGWTIILEILNMTLVKTSINYLLTTKNSYYLIFFMILSDIVFELISAQLMIDISSGNKKMIIYLLVLKLMVPMFDQFILRPLTSNIASSIKKQFKSEGINNYNRLTHQFKNKNSIGKFNTIQGNASMSIYLMPDWGLTNLIGLTGTICSVLWTFYKKQMLSQLLIILLIFALIHYVVVGKMQNNFTKYDKAIKILINRIRTKLDLFLMPFQYNEFTPQFINDLNDDIIDKCNVIDNKWAQIIGVTRLFNQIISIAMGYLNMNDIASFMLITMVMNQLNSAVTNMTYFSTRYNRLKNDYENYLDFWKNSEFVEEPLKLYPSKNLKITGMEIVDDEFPMKFDESFDGLFKTGGIPICSKFKWSVLGSTGKGKSSFVKRFTGKIKGLKFNKGNPVDYYHCTTDMFQGITQKIPSSKATIRDLFKGEINDELIMEGLRDTFEEDELERWLKIIGTESKSNESDIIINLDPKHPFDCELDEKFSGGQWSRLILATRCYDVSKNDKQIFILDEPTSDSDPETSVRILKHIFEKYDHCSIILITHMCECQRKQLGVKWDLELTVSDGIVSKKN